MSTFTTQLWHSIQPLYRNILQHPFNQQLATGDLAPEIFTLYLAQDQFYLEEFARCHALIAAKITSPYIQPFLHYAHEALIAEQEMVHQYFAARFMVPKTKELTAATLGYSSYLLRVCALEPIAVALAAMLPCFWVYQQLSLDLLAQSHDKNPYSHWLESYSGDSFQQSVTQLLDIVDQFASSSHSSLQAQMQTAFYNSTLYEWHFWNDVYHAANRPSLSPPFLSPAPDLTFT